MIPAKTPVYNILVYIAYGYFILIGGAWFIANFVNNGNINPYALFIIAIFAVQAFYKNKVANLVLGILGLFMSIWTLLELIATYNLFAKGASFDQFGKILLMFAILNIIMSGILIFSYMKLNLEPHE